MGSDNQKWAWLSGIAAIVTAAAGLIAVLKPNGPPPPGTWPTFRRCGYPPGRTGPREHVTAAPATLG